MRAAPAILFLLLLLNACRKSDRNNDTDLTLAQDAVNAQAAFFEVFMATHESCLSTTGIRSFVSCATITTDTLGMPRTMVIDFGTSGCVSPSGRTRSGKIIVYQTGGYTQPGSTSMVYFDTFYINGYNYSGTLGINTHNASTWKLSPDLTIAAPDSSFTYILSGALTVGQTAGTVTPVADDDVFDASGNLQVTGRKGNTGSCTVNSGQQLVVSAACAEAVSGKITMHATGQTPRVIDFGSGSCDKTATVTANTATSDLNTGF